MLQTVVFVPSAPLLVSELAGRDASDAEPVRAAALAAVRAAAADTDAWVAIGAGDTSAATSGDRVVGDSFRRFGVDVPVTLDANASGDPGRTPGQAGLPLSMLIAAWFRGQSGIERIQPCVVNPDASPDRCRDVGGRLADSVEQSELRVGVLVVADGSISLSAKAPGGGLRESAVELQRRIDAAIASADVDALASLSVQECAAEGVGGRPAWQVTAELCRDRQFAAAVTYAAAPFGVGYTVATWTPSTSTPTTSTPTTRTTG